MEAHVRACDRCAAHDTAIRRSLLLAHNHLPEIAPSADFADRLARRLASESAESPVTRTLWRSPKMLAAAALGFAAFGYAMLDRLQNERITLATPAASNGALPTVMVEEAAPAFVVSVSSGLAIVPALLLAEEVIRPAIDTPLRARSVSEALAGSQ